MKIYTEKGCYLLWFSQAVQRITSSPSTVNFTQADGMGWMERVGKDPEKWNYFLTNESEKKIEKTRAKIRANIEEWDLSFRK